MEITSSKSISGMQEKILTGAKIIPRKEKPFTFIIWLLIKHISPENETPL